MKYKLRPYQQEASDRAVDFFKDDKKKFNALMVLPTGCGKSVIIADIACRLNANVLVFCPSKELVEQNYEKMCSYGVECSMYSASTGHKDISKITFATIGSAINNIELFHTFEYFIVDECHKCNAQGGQYKDFFSSIPRKVLGLTATPYRLTSYSMGAILKFLTRTRPCIFKELIYKIDIEELKEQGFLAQTRYFSLPHKEWNQNNIKVNSTGCDYTDKSIREEYQRINFYDYLVDIVKRLQIPKSGIPRRGILVFTRFVEEAEALTKSISNCAVVSGETPKKEREQIINDFRSGKIQVVANVGTMTTGFDYPELDTIVFARPTMSLSVWYQCIGRILRPSKTKECAWVVDLCGTYKRYGCVEDLKLVDKNGRGKWVVQSRGKDLTNVFLT